MEDVVDSTKKVVDTTFDISKETIDKTFETAKYLLEDVEFFLHKEKLSGLVFLLTILLVANYN